MLKKKAPEIFLSCLGCQMCERFFWFRTVLQEVFSLHCFWSFFNSRHKSMCFLLHLSHSLTKSSGEPLQPLSWKCALLKSKRMLFANILSDLRPPKIPQSKNCTADVPTLVCGDRSWKAHWLCQSPYKCLLLPDVMLCSAVSGWIWKQFKLEIKGADRTR